MAGVGILGLLSFYEENVTLIQATLQATVLAASVQVTIRAGVLSLASVGFWAIGAYTSGILVRDHGAGVVLSIVTAVSIAALVSVALALILVRLRGMYLAMATASFDFVVIVIALASEDLTGGAIGLYAIPPILQMWQLLVVVGAVAVVLGWTERGHVGRTIAAVGADEDMARALGVHVERVRRRVFVLSGCLGALAGAMSAQMFNNVSPDQFGFGFISLTVAMAVIGGLRSWAGAYLGAIIVTWLPELLRPIEEWRSIVFGLMLILVVTLEPGGFLGVTRKIGRFCTSRRLRARPGPGAVE